MGKVNFRNILILLPITEDRIMGRKNEDVFKKLAHSRGKTVLSFQEIHGEGAAIVEHPQFGHIVLPDDFIPEDNHLHEIKHKAATGEDYYPPNCYGLEKYRLNHIARLMDTWKAEPFYTIRDHGDAGTKMHFENLEKEICYWKIAPFSNLLIWPRIRKSGPSYCNGKKIRCDIIYWEKEWWKPLKEFWDDLDEE